MKHVIVLASVAVALAACSKAVPEDGFKQFKYGMTVADLRQQGFDCDPDDLCSREQSDKRYESETLFGHPASVDVWTAKGRLKSISVNVDIPVDELERQVTMEFGKPESFDYSTFRGGRATQLIWPAENGTSLAMVRPASDSSGFALSHGSLDYNGQDATAELRKTQQKSGVKAGDF